MSSDTVQPGGMFERLGKASAVCGVITMVSDLMEPLGAIAMWSLLLSLVLLLVSMALGSVLRRWREELSVLRLALVLIAGVSAALVYFQSSNPEAAERGFLASKLPAAAELQNSLIRLEQSARKIEENTGRTAVAAEEMSGKMDNLKLETSVDPRKELANMGVPWNYDSMHNAFQNRDTRTLKLLLAGGMIPQYDTLKYTMFVENQLYPEDFLKALIAAKSYDPVRACKDSLPWMGDGLKDKSRAPFIRAVCRNEAFMAPLESELDILLDKVENDAVLDREYKERVSDCVNLIKKYHNISNIHDRSDDNYERGYSESTLKYLRDRYVTRHLMFDSSKDSNVNPIEYRRRLEKIFNDTVEDSCSAYSKNERVDKEKTKRLEELLRDLKTGPVMRP